MGIVFHVQIAPMPTKVLSIKRAGGEIRAAVDLKMLKVKKRNMRLVSHPRVVGKNLGEVSQE